MSSDTECSQFYRKITAVQYKLQRLPKTFQGGWVSLGSMYTRGWVSQWSTMGVQGGWVGQKGSKKHVRNIWTAPHRKEAHNSSSCNQKNAIDSSYLTLAKKWKVTYEPQNDTQSVCCALHFKCVNGLTRVHHISSLQHTSISKGQCSHPVMPNQIKLLCWHRTVVC